MRLFRPDPLMGPASYRTFQIAAPVSTHWQVATCAQVDCEQRREGWQSLIDESQELGQRQAYYIRAQSGRSFTEQRLPHGITEFTFESGQECFAGGHKRRLERPEVFVVRDGDWRGNPRGTDPKRLRADDWVDAFADHQQRLVDEIEKG